MGRSKENDKPWVLRTVNSESERREFADAVERFWSNNQLGYKKGKVVRTNVPRKRPSIK